MTPERRKEIEDDWDCIAGPPPGRFEPWIIGALAVAALIVWCIYG